MIKNIIEQKEQELKKLKDSTKKQNWENYLTKVEKFLDKIKGKVLISFPSNGNLYMFKVLDYHKRAGFNEKHQHYFYYEIESTGYLNITTPDSDNRVYKHAPCKIEENVWFNDISVPYGFHRIIKKKGENILFPKFVINEDSIHNSCDGSLRQLTSVGILNVDADYPDYDTAIERFIGHHRILKNEEFFNKALEIHQRQTLEVLEFYNSFKGDLKNLLHVNDGYTILK